MQRVKIHVEIEYRSDGQMDKSAVLSAVQNLFLPIDREKVFALGTATYAGYTVALPPKKIAPALLPHDGKVE